MSAMHRFSVKGFYKSQFCRSLHEFHACLYLDKVKRVEFFTEPFSMRSETNTKRKIPDIMYIDHNKSRVVIAEVKPTFDDALDVIISYSENKFRCPDKFIKMVNAAGYMVDYEFLVNTKVAFKKDIVEEIGKDEYIRLLAEYRDQELSYTGFPGQLNPMYGRKHTQKTKDIIALTASQPGSKNGMHGKTHTADAKIRSAAKWKNPEKKIAMMRKGMLSHISKFSDEQYDIFMIYANDILSGRTHKRPDFINRAYTVNEKNINAWFDNKETFFRECENVK